MADCKNDYLKECEVTLSKFFHEQLQVMEETPEGDQAKFLNFNHLFESHFGENPTGQAAMDNFTRALQQLYNAVVAIAPAKHIPTACLPAGPGGDAEDSAKFNVNLWKLPFSSKLYIRGATNCEQILTNMSTFITKGNSTHLYPVEVSPIFTGLISGCPWVHPELAVAFLVFFPAHLARPAGTSNQVPRCSPFFWGAVHAAPPPPRTDDLRRYEVGLRPQPSKTLSPLLPRHPRTHLERLTLGSSPCW